MTPSTASTKLSLTAALSAREAMEFDAFVSASPAASHMQESSWPEIAPITKLQHYRFLWYERDGKPLVSGIARFTQVFPGRYIVSFLRGPVFQDLSVLGPCLPELIKSLRQAGACTVLMNPRWEDDAAEMVEGVLAQHGFRKLGALDQPMHAATGLVDLTPPEDEIFAGFKGRCRRHIRGAARAGLVVRAAKDVEDMRRFDRLFAEAAARKHFDVTGLPSIRSQRDVVTRGSGVFLLAELDGQLVGGHVAWREGTRAYWMTLASTEDIPKIGRSYNLLWEAMREMKRQGCLTFDMAGLPDGAARDEAEQNRVQFKLAFNPRFTRLVPTYALAIRPAIHALLFGARQVYRRSSLRRHLAPLIRR